MIPKFRFYSKRMNKIGIVISLKPLRKRVYVEWDDTLSGTEDINDNGVLMQSTGLFDNSTPKKEIFENDIVEWEHKDTGQLVRGIVKYDTELGFWGMTDVRFNDLRAIGYLANQKVTVLGDIYENKELVEELKRLKN